MVNLRAGLRRAKNRPAEAGKAVFRQVREDDVPFMAASIAYQAFVSLVPILLLLFIAVAVVGGEALAERVVAMTEGFLPEAGQSLIRDSIVGTQGGGAGSIIGLVVLVWGSLKIFRGLDKAFSDIYETEGENSFTDQLKDGLVVLPVLGLAVVAVAAATSVFAAFEGPILGLINPLILVVGLTLAFLPMYKLFPDLDLTWKEALPGALFAAVGWTVLQALFQVYLAVSSKGDPSGVIGAILLLLTWLYFSGLVLLIAAVVNAVLLGESARSPVSEEEPAAPEERIADLEAQLARVRDRLDDVVAERDRLSRQLDRESSLDPAPPAEVTGLRRQNRLLRRRLRWLEKPRYERLALRLLGATPPAPVGAADDAFDATLEPEGDRPTGSRAD